MQILLILNLERSYHAMASSCLDTTSNDESGATGESDCVKKLTCSEVVELHRQAVAAGKDSEAGHTDCFIIISGNKALEGVGKYVVVVVGTESFNGYTMMGMIVFMSIYGD